MAVVGPAKWHGTIHHPTQCRQHAGLFGVVPHLIYPNGAGTGYGLPNIRFQRGLVKYPMFAVGPAIAGLAPTT